MSLTFKKFPFLDIITTYHTEFCTATMSVEAPSTKSTRFLSSPSGKQLSLLSSCIMPTFSATFLQLNCTWCCRANANSQALQFSPFTPPRCLHFEHPVYNFIFFSCIIILDKSCFPVNSFLCKADLKIAPSQGLFAFISCSCGWIKDNV